MLARSKIAALLVVVISSVMLVQSVAGVNPVHLGIVCGGCPAGGPVPAGSTFHITFYTDVGENGHINIYDRPSGDPTHIWNSGSLAISGGLAYDVVPTVISTPGTYIAGATFTDAGATTYSMERTFLVTGSGSGLTDWAVLSVSLSPTNPHVGDPVIFKMDMTALSSSGAFPQNFNAQCRIDGADCGGGFVGYPGPAGNPATVSAGTPWMATPGIHTLTWSISTADDSNPSNNVMSQSFTVTSPTPFDFSIAASPPQQTVTPGGGVVFTVSVTMVSGAAQSVILSLTGAPAGVTGTFSPASGAPAFTSTLSIVTTSSASPGTFPLTITGSGGGVTHSAQVILVISQAPPPPDFSIAVSPTSQSGLQGQAVSYSVNVAPLNGFNSIVALSVTGLPSGSTGAFSPASGTPNFVSTLTILLPPGVTPGSFTLTVTGTGGGLSRMATIALIVNQTPATQTSSTEASSTISTSSTQAVTNLPGMSDLMSMLQQNPLLLVGGIVLLIALVAIAALASRHRKPSGPAQGTQQGKPGTKFCTNCGTPNPVGNEFCGKCGKIL